jgi:hypothetical protein
LVWTPVGLQVLDYLNYTNIPPGRSYGDYPDGQPFTRQEFFHVTPGAPNNNTAAPLVVYINEWMAANNTTLLNTNNNNKYDDWFELYNPGNSPADLAGYFLTDNLSNKFQFAIPPGFVIPAHGFKLVWADGAPGLNNTNNPDLHVSFKLAQDGEQIGLFAGDGTLIDAVTFEPQFNDISQGRYPDGPGTNYFLAQATPRGPNTIWANRYPTLAPIADATIALSQTLSFTASASDPDMPPQTLGFTLDPGAPAGAMVDLMSGNFTWTPGTNQAPSTNVMTLRVTDNGTPALSVARTFRVIVRIAPVISNLMRQPNGDISFSVSTMVGKHYRVEYDNNLGDGNWVILQDNILATGTSLTINDSPGNQSQRFYRVVQID